MKSWKPSRCGPIYCAPACGRKCTYIAFTRATKAAAKLVVRLGRGWKAKVFENLGWHYYATNKSMDLNVSYYANSTLYMAILADEWVGYGASPEQAITETIYKAQPAIAEMRRIDAAIKSYQARTK